MKSEYKSYHETSVYEIVLELEENESQVLQSIYRDRDFAFQVERGEGWCIISKEGYHGVVFTEDLPSPGGKFKQNRWEGFLYPNGVPEIPNVEQVADDFIVKIATSVKDIVEAYEKVTNPE